MKIILNNRIESINTVYNNLNGNGDSLKMFNTDLNAEVLWYPEEGKLEMNTVIDDEVYNEVVPLKSFESFCVEFPHDNWFYGYIED